jgi:hypothetical protein
LYNNRVDTAKELIFNHLAKVQWFSYYQSAVRLSENHFKVFIISLHADGPRAFDELLALIPKLVEYGVTDRQWKVKTAENLNTARL